MGMFLWQHEIKLVPETVNDDKTEILSDVILLHIKSYAPLDDNVNESI
jgi:hypothetical protein